MRILSACCSACLVLMVFGCGSNNGLTLASVRGTVTHEGKPVTYGSIMFEPDTDNGSSGPPAVGSINKDGTFVLSTEESADGAVVGSHRVAIIGLDEKAAAEEAALPDPEVDPKSFMQAKAKAGMIANRAKKSESYTDKNGKVFRMTIPSKLANPGTSNLKAVVARGSNAFTIAINEDGSAVITP